MLDYVPTREYRFVVEGDLSDARGVFDGMTRTREEGGTVLAGASRRGKVLRSERADEQAHGREAPAPSPRGV
jgi:hypothetical protein